jgi:hypothetical protein
MGLLAQAATDLVSILEDVDGGFGTRVIVTSPTGVSAELVGFLNDISQTIDPETGLVVTGRSVSLTLPLASIRAGGLPEPRACQEPGVEPWTVEVIDAEPEQRNFIISGVRPDRSFGGGAGAITCFLGVLT